MPWLGCLFRCCASALIADAGNCCTAVLEACEDKGLEAYLSTSRQQHGHRPRPPRGRAPRDLDAHRRMNRKLRSKAGQAIYGLSKTIVEPVFGQIKGARGLDRFRLRGLEKVDGEWALITTCWPRPNVRHAHSRSVHLRVGRTFSKPT